MTRGRLAAWGALAVVLAGGLALRLWGYRSGLPFVYNIDEADHFVPRAVKMFSEGTLNPHYFANPPAFTYLLHFLFAIAYGGGDGVLSRFHRDPAALYELSRIAAAVLGTIALWLLYLVGARLLGRAAGVLAAAIEAVAFLPSFYAHLALNDVPTLAPLTASLLGTAGVLRKGRVRDYLLAGAGLGLACATKYTAGIVIVPLLAAAALRLRGSDRDSWRRVLASVLAGALAALALFVIANPYSVLDAHAFHAELVRQSSQSGRIAGQAGAPREGGIVYYLWSLTWGLGWVPALAALAGMGLVWRREKALGGVLAGAAAVPRLHGAAGALFRALAAADLPDRVPACGRHGGDAGGGAGRARAGRALGRGRRARRRPAGTGRGAQPALRRRERARRHPQRHAGVDVRPHSPQLADRGRAGLAQRLGG